MSTGLSLSSSLLSSSVLSLSSSSSSSDSPLTVSTFYDYDPVYGILVAAAVLFGVQTLVLAYQCVRSRTLFLVWLVVFAACECGGYVAFCVFDGTPTLAAYLAELILIILAPNFVTLVNYVVISRILPWAGFPVKSRLHRHARLVPALFLASDLLCLTLQSIGGSQLSAAHHDGVIDQDKYDLGKTFDLVGIAAQLGFQSVFALLAAYIYVRMPDLPLKRELRWTWLCMLVTMVLVSCRNVYRIVEFAGGQGSAVDSTQVPYLVLDLLLMLLTGLTFALLDLGSDAVFPERIRRGALLGTQAEAEAEAEARHSEQQRAADKAKGVTVVVEMGGPAQANTTSASSSRHSPVSATTTTPAAEGSEYGY